MYVSAGAHVYAYVQVPSVWFVCVCVCARARGRFVVVFVFFERQTDRQTDITRGRETKKPETDRQTLIHTERLRHRQQETERESGVRLSDCERA